MLTPQTKFHEYILGVIQLLTSFKNNNFRERSRHNAMQRRCRCWAPCCRRVYIQWLC